MAQYYTLQEAAGLLGIAPEQLKDMAKKNEVRAFQDRGNLRFRAQEIDELARSRGAGSDPELPLGELPAKTSEPKSGPKSGRSSKLASPPTDAGFEIAPDHDEVPIGQDPASAGSASKNTPRNANTRSPKPKRSGSASPAPSLRVPGSDSDVRLVGEGSDLQFQIDSEVKVEKSPTPGPKTPGSSRKSKLDPGAPDSGVRIVPLDDASDSDVKMVPDDPDSKVPLGQSKSKTPSDSDIRLEELPTDSGKKKRDEKNLVTEEIDLDAEEMKAAREAAAQKKQRPKSRVSGSSGQLPTHSPFELSEPEVHLEPKKKTEHKRASRVEKEKKDDTDSSSDFELTPTKDGSSPLDVGSDEMTPIKLDDSSEEEVGLGELTASGAGTSGINLKDPVDSGISLEQGGSDEMEIELNLDAGATPKPKSKVDSSSEFELSLDDSDGAGEEEEGSSSEFELTLDEPSSPTEEGSSSEFELSLDLDESSSVEMESPGQEGGSDSEFELTIDEGGLGMEESGALDEEDKDIFETDFDVPALDGESGSEAVALDEEGADLESSDFDLDVDEDVDTEAESGSEVVALDEELEPAPTAKKKKKKKDGRTLVVDEDEQPPSEFEDLETDAEPVKTKKEVEPEPEPEEEEEEAAAAAAVAPRPQSWGVFTPICATVSAFILFFVMLMSYEMIQDMYGYHKSTPASSLVLKPVARMFFGDEPSLKD